jgi:DNA-binding XRE family transcriptional regulator
VGDDLPMRDKSSENVLEKVIDELTKARKSQGISHETLAKKTGISRSGISFIERHMRVPTLLTCLRISKALNVRLADIIGRFEK